METPFKLAINPGPKRLEYQTLHRKLGVSLWKKWRICCNPGFCEICNWRQPDKPSSGDALRMHEVFEYEIKRRGKSVAYLRDVKFLCNRCHGIAHRGYMTAKLIKDAEERLLRGTRFDLLDEAALARHEGTVEHFCNINRCSRDDFFRHAEDAVAQKKERDLHPWRIDWTMFEPRAVEDFIIKHTYAPRREHL
jgi:hypothetical protein